jgi:hypothetical protein
LAKDSFISFLLPLHLMMSLYVSDGVCGSGCRVGLRMCVLFVPLFWHWYIKALTHWPKLKRNEETKDFL